MMKTIKRYFHRIRHYPPFVILDHPHSAGITVVVRPRRLRKLGIIRRHEATLVEVLQAEAERRARENA